MSAQYSRDHVKISVAKILQTLGWHSINTTPLEVLTDILANYITQIGKITNEYATEFGHTEPNLDHLGLAFRDMNVNLVELDEYVTNVNFAPPAAPVPKFPLPKENNLNFLKPGSKEVVTRPVHIHEHLPPMYPLLEGAEAETEIKQEEPEGDTVASTDNGQVFKKPADVSPIEFKRTRKEEEGSRPTREISSVMMTTSGFLSPAREGKLPEARSPIPPIVEPPPPPPPAPTPSSTTTTPEAPINPPSDQPMNLVKSKKHEKKKDKVHKELFKADEKPSKKGGAAREVKKHQKANGESKPKKEKVNKTLAAARMKTEKLNTTITPIPSKADCVGKLFNEPDKKKVNILKKISNVKNEKHEGKVKKEEPMSHGSSPDLVIDEPDDIVNRINLPNDITIEPIPPPSSNYYKSPDKPENPYFDSPPGTPSTPKTPELISSPPQPKEKRKRKESKRVSRKVQKLQHTIEPDVMDMDMERPKTPEVLGLKDAKQLMANMPFPFLPSFGGPGLIPPPMPNPLFPFNMANLAKNQFMPGVPGINPLIPNFMPMPAHQTPYFVPPKEEKESRQKVREPPAVEITPIPAPSAPKVEEPQPSTSKPEKKSKEHKKDKKDKKKNKKDKLNKAEKAEKKKLKEEKKEKIKKEKKERKKGKETKEEIPKLLLKFNNPNGRPDTPDTIRKVTVKPVVKKNEEEDNDGEKESLAKISALYTGPPKASKSQPSTSTAEDAQEDVQPAVHVPVPRSGPGPGRPRIHPIKTKAPAASKPKKRRISIKKDEEGKEVWICPGCEKQDDGSPMIGCDGCDAWYHWVCVGIQVPPDENENWYCRYCLLKKNEGIQSDKKKKRKKREKKEH